VDHHVIAEQAQTSRLAEHTDMHAMAAEQCGHGVDQGGLAAGEGAIEGDEAGGAEGA
jgi:hypothetical protein